MIEFYTAKIRDDSAKAVKAEDKLPNTCFMQGNLLKVIDNCLSAASKAVRLL